MRTLTKFSQLFAEEIFLNRFDRPIFALHNFCCRYKCTVEFSPPDIQVYRRDILSICFTHIFRKKQRCAVFFNTAHLCFNCFLELKLMKNNCLLQLISLTRKLRRGRVERGLFRLKQPALPKMSSLFQPFSALCQFCRERYKILRV